MAQTPRPSVDILEIAALRRLRDEGYSLRRIAIGAGLPERTIARLLAATRPAPWPRTLAAIRGYVSDVSRQRDRHPTARVSATKRRKRVRHG